MLNIIFIGIGGALGAVARYSVDQLAFVHLGSSVAGTFIVNISGSFLLGLLAGVLSSNSAWPGEIRLFFAVGFLGSFTTFSTLTLATVQSIGRGDTSGATINLGASIICGLVAAVIGLFVGRAI